MTVREKKKIYITNAASLWLLILGPIFLLLNLLQGHYQLSWVNATSSMLGLICLLFNWRGVHSVAAILVLVGGCAIFSFSGLMFHNGMEYTVLLTMVGSVFMFDAAKIRLPLAFISGVAFLVVKILLYRVSSPEQMPLPRYAINMSVFVACFYCIMELFRTMTSNYQREIEEKNAELARATRELKAANLAKEKLFSIVAHDLRGPVGNLKSSMELLDSGALRSFDFQAMLGDLKADVEHAYDCLDTLLLWSARQLTAIQPVYTAFSLAAVSQRCVDLLADTAGRKKITLNHGVPVGAWVWADQDQVAAIFRNLLSNALKFTPCGGVVDLCAREQNGFWQVTISDTGVGMSKERAAQLLLGSGSATSTLGTENEKGLGLGLQICQEFVQSNGGVLSVESEEDRGSSFQFTLPSRSRES